MLYLIKIFNKYLHIINILYIYNMNHKKESLKEDDELSKFNSKYEDKKGIILGTYNDLPDFFKDNEYIRKGYLINCNSKLKALKSLFYLHNETVNIWSHLLGAIFFFCLIWYTAIYIKEKSSFSEIIESVSGKLETIKEKVLNLMEIEHIAFGREKNINLTEQAKKLKRWPLFIFLVSAILCLFFSALYHLMSCVSPIYHEILSRFDYGGISLLITGSCFPPYYYYFYCESKLRIFYLTFISIFGLSTFFLSLTNNFNKPKMRNFRGKLFLLFGVTAGIPVLHIMFLGNKLKGYSADTRFLYWYLGGITYIIGAVLYIIRFPEKKFPGKVDYFGSSHQLFHFLVVIAAAFHYLGCLDSYYMRLDNLCK